MARLGSWESLLNVSLGVFEKLGMIRRFSSIGLAAIKIAREPT